MFSLVDEELFERFERNLKYVDRGPRFNFSPVNLMTSILKASSKVIIFENILQNLRLSLNVVFVLS